MLARLIPLLFVLLASAQDTGSLPLTELEQVKLENFILKIQDKNRQISEMTLKIQAMTGEASVLAAQRSVFEAQVLRDHGVSNETHFVSESTRTIQPLNPPTPRPVSQ